MKRLVAVLSLILAVSLTVPAAGQQFAYPASDKAEAGNWFDDNAAQITPANLAEQYIDEGATPDDLDYILHQNPVDADEMECYLDLTSVTDPGTATGTLRARVAKNASGGRQIDWAVRLNDSFDDETLCTATETDSDTTFTEISCTFPVDNIDSSSFGSSTGLYVDMDPLDVSGSGAPRQAFISWVEVEIPSAGGAPKTMWVIETP